MCVYDAGIAQVDWVPASFELPDDLYQPDPYEGTSSVNVNEGMKEHTGYVRVHWGCMRSMKVQEGVCANSQLRVIHLHKAFGPGPGPGSGPVVYSNCHTNKHFTY
jgi:hypothetical protein